MTCLLNCSMLHRALTLTLRLRFAASLWSNHISSNRGKKNILGFRSAHSDLWTCLNSFGFLVIAQSPTTLFTTCFQLVSVYLAVPWTYWIHFGWFLEFFWSNGHCIWVVLFISAHITFISLTEWDYHWSGLFDRKDKYCCHYLCVFLFFILSIQALCPILDWQDNSVLKFLFFLQALGESSERSAELWQDSFNLLNMFFFH